MEKQSKTAVVWIGAHIYLIPLEKYQRIVGTPSVKLFDTFDLKGELDETFRRC